MSADVSLDSSVPEEFPTAALRLDRRDHSVQEFLKYLLRNGHLKRLLSQWAVEQVVRREAQLRELSIPGEMLQKAADNFRRSGQLLSASATSDWLSRNGMTILDFEDELEASLLKDLLFEAITENAECHFTASASSRDRIQVRLILVEQEGLAEEIKSQVLEENGDFSTLASKHSVHASAAQGGLLKEMFRCELKQLAGTHAEQAKTADLIGPLAMARGWILVSIGSVTPATFDAETERAIRQDLFQRWLSARLREAKISFPLLDLLSCQNDS